MAGTKRNELIGRLAGLSEDTIQRLSDAPGADRVVGAVTTMRDRVDELSKRVRGLEDLEKRLAALERKVDKLSKSGGSASSGSSASKKPTSAKSSGATGAKKS
jgi:hypothetical protein